MTPTAKKHRALKVREVAKHPSVRFLLFTLAILVSVAIVEAIHARAEVKVVGGLSLSAFLTRGAEVLTDVICDRLFPEA